LYEYKWSKDLKKCIVCGKEFDGVSRDVCSWQCDENRKKNLQKKLDEAVKTDKSHTKKLSQ
jgi:predicted nucleic acid-binding Zn ribbon protein